MRRSELKNTGPHSVWTAFLLHCAEGRCAGNSCYQVSMTGLRSQRSMKRGSTRIPVCSELRLFSREAMALIDCRGWNREDGLLESKRHATAHRACRLHQVNRVPVIPQHRDISLRQKIAQINDGFDVAGKEPGSRDRLSEKETQIRISSPRRRIEHINRSESFSVDPAVRCHPASF